MASVRLLTKSWDPLVQAKYESHFTDRKTERRETVRSGCLAMGFSGQITLVTFSTKNIKDYAKAGEKPCLPKS